MLIHSAVTLNQTLFVFLLFSINLDDIVDPHVDAGKQPVALSLAKNETQKKSWVDKLLERIETKWKHVDTVTEFPEVQTRYSTKYPPTMYTEYSEAKTTPNTQVLTMVAPVNGQTPTLMSGTPGKPRVLGTLAVEVTKMPEGKGYNLPSHPLLHNEVPPSIPDLPSFQLLI